MLYVYSNSALVRQVILWAGEHRVSGLCLCATGKHGLWVADLSRFLYLGHLHGVWNASPALHVRCILHRVPIMTSIVPADSWPEFTTRVEKVALY